MIQAGCDGSIDYCRADLHDPRWWQKLAYVLDFIKRKTRIQLDEWHLEFNLAVLDYSTDKTLFDRHWKQAEQAHGRLVSHTQPWVATGAQSAQAAAARMRQQWIDKWGDPATPETKAEIQRLRDHWKSQRKRRPHDVDRL